MACLLSIIIPCFNSAAFLQSTLDMLEDEDTDECEIILINDGSSDETLNIIEQNIKKYKNIRYISHENKGVSISRNEGLLSANGQFVYFLDSDDEITKGTLRYYKALIHRNINFDLLAFGYKMISTNGTEKLYVNQDMNGCILPNTKCADLFFRGLLYMHVCSILLNRGFLISNQLFFEENIRIGEDYDFIRKVTLYAKKTLYDSRISFVYKLRNGSATDGQKGYGSDHFQSLLLSFKTAKIAEGLLEKRTLNYYLAARYSAHLKSYLNSSYKAENVNLFFLENRKYLYRSMNSGRRSVMLAIFVFRFTPIRTILKLSKQV